MKVQITELDKFFTPEGKNTVRVTHLDLFTGEPLCVQYLSGTLKNVILVDDPLFTDKWTKQEAEYLKEKYNDGITFTAEII